MKNKFDDCTAMERPQEILIDVIGLGAGVVDRLAEQNLPVRGVNVAEAPSTKKNYLNVIGEYNGDGRRLNNW